MGSSLCCCPREVTSDIYNIHKKERKELERSLDGEIEGLKQRQYDELIAVISAYNLELPLAGRMVIPSQGDLLQYYIEARAVMLSHKKETLELLNKHDSLRKQLNKQHEQEKRLVTLLRLHSV